MNIPQWNCKNKTGGLLLALWDAEELVEHAGVKKGAIHIVLFGNACIDHSISEQYNL